MKQQDLLTKWVVPGIATLLTGISLNVVSQSDESRAVTLSERLPEDSQYHVAMDLSPPAHSDPQSPTQPK